MQAYKQPISANTMGVQSTDLDNLSDDEILKLINGTGKARVAPQVKPKPVNVVDLDRYFNE